ncbi:MAG: hypothetical protein WEB58_13565 [Planctomycetaceae bacterium]
MSHRIDALFETLFGYWQTATLGDYTAVALSIVVAAWFWGRIHRR